MQRILDIIMQCKMKMFWIVQLHRGILKLHKRNSSITDLSFTVLQTTICTLEMLLVASRKLVTIFLQLKGIVKQRGRENRKIVGDVRDTQLHIGP